MQNLFESATAEEIANFLKNTVDGKVIIMGNSFRMSRIAFNAIQSYFEERECYVSKASDIWQMKTNHGAKMLMMPMDASEPFLCGERTNWLVLTSGYTEKWLNEIGRPLLTCRREDDAIKQRIVYYQNV